MKKATKVLTRAALVACIVMASSIASHAQVLINGNFLSTSGGATSADGAAVLGSSGDYWNNFGAVGTSQVLTSNAVNAANVATGIQVSSSADHGYSDGATNGPVNPSFLMSGYVYNSTSDTPQNVQLTLSNLTAYDGDTFTLEVYAAGNQSGQGSNLTLSGASTATGSTTGIDRDISDGSGDAYYQFTGTISGDTLGILATPGSSSFAAINGFQLELTPGEAVPEPSTWALMLAGVAALVVFSHRRHVSKS